MPLKTILMKPASSECNMSCDYCFYCDEAQKRKKKTYGMMAETTLKNIIKKILFHTTSDICFAFQGGEPTLRGISFFEKAIEWEQRFNRNGVSIQNTLQTNGLLIDDKWCTFFRKNHFLIGISVDGIQETHDQSRHTKNGSPTYSKVKESIQLLNAYGIDYNILTVVNAYTAPNIREIYADYKRNGWYHQQYIPCLEPLDEDCGSKSYSLTPEMYGQFLIQLFQLWHKDWKHGKAPFIREFENYIAICMGYIPESCAQRGICSIQGVTEADGSVYPCDFYVLDEYCLGNFNQDDIKEIFNNPVAKKFVTDSMHLSDKCLNCIYYPICRGGCRRTRIKCGNTLQNYFCESYQLFFEKTLKQMLEIASYLKK